MRMLSCLCLVMAMLCAFAAMPPPDQGNRDTTYLMNDSASTTATATNATAILNAQQESEVGVIAPALVADEQYAACKIFQRRGGLSGADYAVAAAVADNQSENEKRGD